MNPRAIVCATDFSPGADRALDVAVTLARGLSAPLSLVHTMDTAPGAGEVVTPEIATAVAVMRARIDARIEAARAALADRVRTIEGIVVTTHVLDGRPDEAIARHATSVDARVIVVGSHGLTRGADRVTRVVLGSTAERVLHSSHRPVLVVPSSVTSSALERAPWTVAVGIDDVAPQVLDVAFGLAGELGQVPRAVHVVPSSEMDERPATRRFDDLVSAASRRHGDPVDDSGTWVVRGRVAEVITDFARDVGGVLVVGSHGGGLVARALGSTASRVIARAEIPVLVVPPAR